MRRLLSALFALLLSSSGALAQSNPNLVFGQVPTALQWNSFFSAKQDVVGSLGGVLSGFLPAPTFNPAVTPTFAGITLSGLASSGTSCVQASATGALSITGSTCGSGGAGAVNSVSNSDGSLTVSPTTGVVVASLNTAHNNNWSGTVEFTGSPFTLTTNGQGTVGASSTNGGILAGQGSVNDVTVENKSGSAVCNIATATTIWTCGQDSIGTSTITTLLNVTGTFESNGHAMTFPGAVATLAALNAAQTWTSAQSFNSGDLILNGSSSGSTTLNAPSAGGGTLTLPTGTHNLLAEGLQNLTTTGASGTTEITSANTGFTNNLDIGNSGTVSNVATAAQVLANLDAGSFTYVSFNATGGATPVGGLSSGAGLTGGLIVSSGAGPVGITGASGVTIVPTSGVVAITNPNLTGTVEVGGTATTIAALNIQDQTLTGGTNVTVASLGTVSSGSITIDCGKSPLQTLTDGGAFTLTAPSNDGSCAIRMTNNATAGTVTFSGFTVNSSFTGGSLNTTNGNAFVIFIQRILGSSIYSIIPQQ